MGELLTAVKYRLPVKVIIFNNGKLGLIQMEQEAEGLPEFETDLQNPNYAALAEAMGVNSWSVSKPQDLKTVLHDALAKPGPAVVDVKVNPTELTWPPSIKVSQAIGFGVSNC